MFSEDLKTLRSNFLVHWTGRDIEQKYPFHSEAKHAEYLFRLIGTLEEGLWMNKVKIELFDEPNQRIETAYKLPVTCFTEIKLSQSEKHIGNYGRLGFGFDRKFVMERYGAPVLYMAVSREDTISTHILKLCRGLNNNNELLSSILTIGIFTKRMSNNTNPHDFQYLDELEWRIPATMNDLNVKPCIKYEVKREEMVSTDKKPIARIRFHPDDLKVLIFPDDETRKKASDDSYFQCWLKKREGFPIMATVKECEQF